MSLGEAGLQPPVFLTLLGLPPNLLPWEAKGSGNNRICQVHEGGHSPHPLWSQLLPSLGNRVSRLPLAPHPACYFISRLWSPKGKKL